MKILDVDQLQAGLTRNIDRMNRLEQEVSAIQKAVKDMTAMEDALKGEGGQAIRDFYKSCHLPFLQYFLAFKEEFNTVLQQAQQALATLEPMEAGHIVEEFLETDIEKGLVESADTTATLTDEANAIMDEVSDIIGLTKLDDTLVQKNIADAKKKRDATVEELQTFDSTQTNQLVPIETSIQSMKEWVQNIEGLFKEGLTDVGFPSDKWSSIAGNSAIVMKLSAMGVETGIEAAEIQACERPVETDVESDRAWYQVVGDVLIGFVEGVFNAVVDIFKGLFDLLKSLFTDPIGFFKGILTAIMNPIDTFNMMWDAVETAWNRDVINGDARSRASFFSYTLVSIVGLKGIDKVGKLGRASGAAGRVDSSPPYNVFQTDKLKELINTNVFTYMREQAGRTWDLMKSGFAQSAVNQAIQAVRNSKIINQARNVLNPDYIKSAISHMYENVIKGPISSTMTAIQSFFSKGKPVILGPDRDSSDADVGAYTDANSLEVDAVPRSFAHPGEYFTYINQIGSRTDLTSAQKFAMIQEAYVALEVKGDVTVVADMKYLKPEGFGSQGRMLVDWPDNMGFVVDSIQTITRDNPLPESWDRVGGKGGENFTVLPDDGVPYTYDERAIPYIENPQARHVGTFNNETYFDAIDAVKNGDLEELNRIAEVNGKGPIPYADLLDFKAHYEDFQENAKSVVGDMDATYGLKGTAAPWINSSTGEKLMEGGAEQIVTPLSAEMLEKIGVIPKY